MKDAFKKIILLMFVSLILFTVSSSTSLSTKPTGPFDITMSLSEAPVLNKPVKLIVNVTSIADVTNASIEILTTEGIAIIKGDTLRKEKLYIGEIIQIEITLKAIKTGDQEIAVFVSRNETWGFDSNSVSLYIDVGEKSARVSGRPLQPPPTPKPKRQTERPYYLKLRVSGTPYLNNSVELTVTAASIVYQQNATINLFLPEGFEVVEGSLKWKGTIPQFPTGEARISDEDFKKEIAKGRQPMDIIFDYIPADKQVQFKVRIKAAKTGDWQIIALPFEERPYAIECYGLDNPVKVKKEDAWERYTVGGCLNVRVQNDTAIVNEMPLPLESKVVEESSSSSNTYVVIFREWTAENKKQVISIEGIEFIRDTTVGEEGYPAILISANLSIAEKIKEFSFVLDIKPAEEVKDVMPRSETKITTGLPVISVILLILFVWWIKRRDSND